MGYIIVNILPCHVRHEAAVTPASFFVLRSWPHYFDGGQGAELAKELHQLLFRQLGAEVAQVDVGGGGVPADVVAPVPGLA